MEQNTPRTGLTGRVRNYYDEVISEGKRVTWPSKEDIRGGSIVMLALLVGLSVVLGFVDWFLGKVVAFLFT
jgi:preprotein translocase SecE subunit